MVDHKENFNSSVDLGLIKCEFVTVSCQFVNCLVTLLCLHLNIPKTL